VPSVKQQLQQQWFALEGPSEAHAAIWQLLVHSSSSSSTQLVKAPAKPAAAAAASTDIVAEHQLLWLLRLQSSSSVQQLQRQVVLLQLMVDAQTAAASRQRLWSDTVRDGVVQRLANVCQHRVPSKPAEPMYCYHSSDCVSRDRLQLNCLAAHRVRLTDNSAVQLRLISCDLLPRLQVLAALRKLAAHLKEMEGPVAHKDAAAAASHKATFSSSDTESDNEAVDGAAHGTAGDKQQHQQQATDVKQLQHRQSAQLQPTALRLVKELLTQGGGKTD
jgi:hypothetical protein